MLLINGQLIPINICLNPILCPIEPSASSFLTHKINFSSKEDQSIKKLSLYVGPIHAVLIPIWSSFKMDRKMLNQSEQPSIEHLTDNLKWISHNKSSSLLIKFSTKHLAVRMNSLENMKLITYFYANLTQKTFNMNLWRIKFLKFNGLPEMI